MQLAMARRPNNKTFFGWLSNPYARGDVLDREFDEDANLRPATAEPLDWHQTRHWPVLATD